MRNSAGLSQSALAKQLKTTQTAVSYYETGKRTPSPQRLVDVANALGAEPGEVFAEVTGQTQTKTLDQRVSDLEDQLARIEGLLQPGQEPE